MTPERYQRIGQLFDAVLEIVPEDRAYWLDQNCESDVELRADVERLLAHHIDSDDFLVRPAINVAATLLAKNQQASMRGQLGHYEIISLLGVGGMGEVYLAEDTRLGRQVALKVLWLGFRDQEQRLLQLEQEARAASALNHPNILTVYETGEAAGVPFIAAEYVRGENLRDRLERSPLDVAEVLEIGVQLCAALDAAHQAGIIHRDVKPENVVIRKDGLVKLLDFGIAKLSEPRAKLNGPIDTSAPELARTSHGMIMGTVSYMSPEQVRGLTADSRSDGWSLGVMLYEMSTGQLPFTEETVSDTIASVLTTEPQPLTNLNSDIPTELQRIVLRGLRKDPDDRYQNIRDLLIDLRDLKENLSFLAQLKETERRERPGVNPVPETPYLPARSLAEKLITGTRLYSRFAALTILFIFALALVALHFTYIRWSQLEASPIDSIAVLPFVSLKPETATEYLRDGLTESLISSLSQLPQLRVVPRSTMLLYKGRDIDPQAIGKELGVRAVLTGRVSQEGDDLIISVELVDVADGTQLWGERYSRRNAELVSRQQSIAREISKHVQLRLSGAQGQIGKFQQ